MAYFSEGAIAEIPTDTATVHAFRVTGHIDDDASEALAKHMIKVFDREGKVSMLLDLTGYTGSDWDSILDGDVLTSRFRALKHVARYAVVGAPEKASKMIEFMDKLIPVDARAFDADQMADAWHFVGGQPSQVATA